MILKSKPLSTEISQEGEKPTTATVKSHDTGYQSFALKRRQEFDQMKPQSKENVQLRSCPLLMLVTKNLLA